MLTDAEWVLRGVALVEAAVSPAALIGPNLFTLISDLDGESSLMLVTAILGVVGRLGDELDQGEIRAVLDRTRSAALQMIGSF